MHQSGKKVQLAGLLLAVAALAACSATEDSEGDSAPASTAMENPAASLLPDNKLSKTTCGERSALRTPLYGALSSDVEWQHADMQCEGMPRPNGAGARFFSTSDLESCWTDIEWNAAPGEYGDRFVIGGVLYCISPLPEVNGNASISISEMHFSGLLDWTAT